MGAETPKGFGANLIHYNMVYQNERFLKAAVPHRLLYDPVNQRARAPCYAPCYAPTAGASAASSSARVVSARFTDELGMRA